VVVIVAELIVFSASTVRAAGAQGGATAKSTFQAKCAMCHGPDGAGSSVGKSMNIPNLRSDTVQKTSDAELAQVISDGKGGMPPFKSSLSAAQIHALVKYVRTLRQKK
jgi:mono/diheme cytochrome c family protein